jgi:hypothetical protein
MALDVVEARFLKLLTSKAESYLPISNALFLAIARSNRPNKQREAKSSTHLTFL